MHMRAFLLAGLVLTGWITPLSPTTYYVSHTGSNAPPYTSWATAADSIGTVFALTQPYDTVRVGPGNYTDSSLVLRQGMVFLGSGMDSTQLQLTPTANPDSAPLILLNCIGDSIKIEGFYFRGSLPGVGFQRLVRKAADTLNVFVSFNKFSNSWYGVEILASPFAPGPVGDATEIRGNYFFDCLRAIDVLGRNCLIVNNIVSRSYELSIGGGNFNGKVIGNICLPTNNRFASQIAVGNDVGPPKEVSNNVVLGADDYGISVGGDARVENNTSAYNGLNGLNMTGGTSVFVQNNISIKNGQAGLVSEPNFPPSNPIVRYNDFWRNKRTFAYPVGWDTVSFEGRLSKDPMFVDSLDAHLQFGSPCIDAGAPEIKDPDSSRSDMGAYGGLFGATYAYQDLPPKAPDSLQGFFEDSLILLTWVANTESDLGSYFLYRDTFSIPAASPALLLAQIPAFSLQYLDTQIVNGKTYFYRLEAADTTNHKSPLSNEVILVATGVGDEPQNRPRSFELFQNYPNPFNSSTQIRFRLPPEGSHPARLDVFNSLGQKIKTLLNRNLSGGDYVVFWDGKDENGTSVSSGIYFAALRWRDSRKTIAMVLLK